MATYQELHDLFNSGTLLEKVDVAVVISANNLITATPDANQKAWASAVFANPRNEARKAVMAILAQNAALTVVQITGATDVSIQASVDSVTQVLVDALAGV